MVGGTENKKNKFLTHYIFKYFSLQHRIYICVTLFLFSLIPKDSVNIFAKLNCRALQCRNLLWNLGLLEYLTGEEDWNLENIVSQTAIYCPNLPGRGPGRAVVFITAVVTAKIGTVGRHRPAAVGWKPEGKEFLFVWLFNFVT